jgi:hypothetical protein
MFEVPAADSPMTSAVGSFCRSWADDSARPGAPRDRTYLECLRPPAGADRGLQVSRGNVLEHLLLERQIGNKTLGPNVFPLQGLQAPGLIKLKTPYSLRQRE